MSTERRALLLVWAVHVAAAGVLLSTVVVYLGRPPRGDEMDFTWMAREGIAAHGAPSVAADVTTKRLPPPAVASTYYGLWHPPLYLYALGAAAAVAPTSIPALRVVGVLSLALSFLILWRWSTEALGRDTPAASASVLQAALTEYRPLYSTTRSGCSRASRVRVA